MHISKKEYEEKIRDFYNELHELETKSTINRFCWFVLKSYKSELIDDKKLAYEIAGLMQFELTKCNDYREIVSLAGEYELPNCQITSDIPEKLLDRIILLLESLPRE